MAERFYFLKDIWAYLSKTKKWWLLPLIAILFLMGLLIIAGSVSPVPIFIYPLI